MSFEYASSDSDEDEMDLRKSMDSKVIIDAWQNQRFKPLQGGWTKPFDMGVPYFSDLSGSRKIDFETDEDDGEVVPHVVLKEGWSFVDEWEIDTSGAFGDADAEGWSYATSFESIFELTGKRMLSGDMQRMSLVRRRRWVRVKECSDHLTKIGFKELVSWNEQLRFRLGKVLEEKEEEFSMYLDHHTARSEQAEVVVRYSTEGMEEVVSVMSHVVRNLKYVREFLLERGEIEAQHARQLDALSERWKDKGGLPPSLRADSSASAPASDIASGSDDTTMAQQPQTTEFGFFTCICTADALAASRMSSFAYMLTDSLPSDVGSVLDEAQALLHDCLSEDLCAAVREGQEAAKMRFNQYRAAMLAVRVASATERSRLESTLTSESAADAAPVSAAAAATVSGRERASSSLPSGGSSSSSNNNNSTSNNNIAPTRTDPMGHREYTGQVQKNDVFVALREYRVAVLTADSLITQYAAFVKQQRKAARLLGIRIQALLQAMVKMFSHEFKRLYEDTSADLSRLLGSVEQAQQLQRRLSQQGETAMGGGQSSNNNSSRALRRSVSGIVYQGPEREEVHEYSNPTFPAVPLSAVVARSGVLRVAVRSASEAAAAAAAAAAAPAATPERSRALSSFSGLSPSELLQAANESFSGGSPSRNSTASASAAAGNENEAMNNGYGSGEWVPCMPGADPDAVQWLYSMVVVTYDGSLLLFPPTPTQVSITEEVFKYGQPWQSLSLVGAKVSPLFLHTGDAFGVRTKSANFALMVCEGQGPGHVVEWMRLCINPLMPPDQEPPIPDGLGE